MDAIKTAKVWIGERKGITSPIHVSQYDTAWTFQFKVYKDDLIYEPENAVSVVFTGKKSDDTVFAVPADFEDGVATVASTVAMTSAAGIVECELRFSESGETVGTANFDMVVEPSPVEGGTPSEDDFTTLQTMVDAVAQNAAAAEAAADTAAQEVLAEVPEMVYDWLEANVTPETGYVIDSGLTIQGAAADAKAAGDAISDLSQTDADIIGLSFKAEKPLLFQTAANYALKGVASGICYSNSSFQMTKYRVYPNTLYYLKLAKDSDGVAQWQRDQGVYTTGTSTTITGAPITKATDGYFLAPSDANYLIVSELKTNTTNIVKRMNPVISEFYADILIHKMVKLESGNFVESGNYDIKQDNVARFRSVAPIPRGLVDAFTLPAGYQAWFYTYDKDFKYVSKASGWAYSLSPKAWASNIAYFHIVIRKESTPSADISADMETVQAGIAWEFASGLDTNYVREQTFGTSFHTGATDFADKCAQFSALMQDVEDCESFLFFTDPHLMHNTGWEQQCYELVAQIQKYYNATPTNFCLCGGDWIGNSDSVTSACYKLGYIDGFMRGMFHDVYLMVGNHDTNYQGTERLSEATINNLWYRKEGKAFYTIDGSNTKFYVFDTGIEAQALSSQDNYGMRQAEWFANALLTDNTAHIAVALHILYNTISGMVIHPLADEVLTIAEAYNGRTSIIVNGNTYDYSSAQGRVEFAIFGHTHDDYSFTIHGIPCIVTTWVRASETVATFDLVFVNYDDREINLVRVGSGSDRTVSLD